MIRKKCAIMLGGSGQLGRETVKMFVGGRKLRRWRVFNIDKKENPEASHNFIIDPSKPITKDIVAKLHDELTEFDDEYEAIINLAGHYYPPNSRAYQQQKRRELEKETGTIVDTPPNLIHPMMISNPACFDEYEKIQQTEFLSTMLSVHLAEGHLSPTGYVLFVGSKDCLHGLSSETTPLENMAKSVVS